MVQETVTDYKTVEETRTVHYCDSCGNQVDEDEIEYCGYGIKISKECKTNTRGWKTANTYDFETEQDFVVPVRNRKDRVRISVENMKELCPTCSGEKALVKKEREFEKRSYRQALAQKVFTWSQVGGIVCICTFFTSILLFIFSMELQSMEIFLISLSNAVVSFVVGLASIKS